MSKKSLALGLALSALLSSACLAAGPVYTKADVNFYMADRSAFTFFSKYDDDHYEKFHYWNSDDDTLIKIFTVAPRNNINHYYTSNPELFNKMLSSVENLEENGTLLNGSYVIGGDNGSFVNDYGATVYDIWLMLLPWDRYSRYRTYYYGYQDYSDIHINIHWPEDHYWYRQSHRWHHHLPPPPDFRGRADWRPSAGYRRTGNDQHAPGNHPGARPPFRPGIRPFGGPGPQPAGSNARPPQMGSNARPPQTGSNARPPQMDSNSRPPQMQQTTHAQIQQRSNFPQRGGIFAPHPEAYKRPPQNGGFRPPASGNPGINQTGSNTKPPQMGSYSRPPQMQRSSQGPFQQRSGVPQRGSYNRTPPSGSNARPPQMGSNARAPQQGSNVRVPQNGSYQSRPAWPPAGAGSPGAGSQGQYHPGYQGGYQHNQGNVPGRRPQGPGGYNGSGRASSNGGYSRGPGTHRSSSSSSSRDESRNMPPRR